MKKKYKYRLRNMDNLMIFRYDNAPHHQDVDSFPNHKHLPGKILNSTEPDVKEILSEIKSIIEKNE